MYSNIMISLCIYIFSLQFGALFLGGTWILLYEWGSDISIEDEVVSIVSRIFRIVMAGGKLALNNVWTELH